MRDTAMRLAFVVLVTVSGFAVFLGRTSPEPEPPPRFATPPRFYTIHNLFPTLTAPRVLDALTGDVRTFRLSGPDQVVDCASCSPWRDSLGEWQFVTRWRRSSTSQSFADGPFCGLARYSYPGARLIDRVSCDRLPCGPPAWLPGTAARVVFAAGDVDLYGYDFERPYGITAWDGMGAFEPRPLRWHCPRPTGSTGAIWDVSCPSGVPGGPWLLVTVSHNEPGQARSRMASEQVWWLGLSADARAVVEASQVSLDGPAEPSSEPDRIRHPQLFATPGGGLTLAFLAECEGRRSWAVRVAAVDLDPSAGSLRALPGATRTLAEGALMAPPAFSPDGRWVFALQNTDAGDQRVIRLANPLAARSPGPMRASRGETRLAAEVVSSDARGGL